MKKIQYSPEESLQRIKLMMGYDMSKTLNENKEIIFEQNNQDELIAKSFYDSAAGLGTDEEGMVSAIESIKDKGQFYRVDNIVKQLYKTNFRKENFGIETIINNELGAEDLKYIKQITEHLKNIGIPATYSEFEFTGGTTGEYKKQNFKGNSFRLNYQTSGSSGTSGMRRNWKRQGENVNYQTSGSSGTSGTGSNTDSHNQPITTPNTYEDVQSGKGVLKKGMKGPAVNQLQQMLVALGYNLGTTGVNKNGIDGDFGNLTQNAVKDFQSKNGLLVKGVPDGIVGKNTAPKIVEKYNEDQKATTPEQPDSGKLAQGKIPTSTRFNRNFWELLR